jgi:MraZ protein
MFTGHYEHTIDEKGRITVPSKFRDELVDSVVITMGFDGNLLAFPHDLFVLLAGKVRGTSLTDSNSRILRRLLFSASEELEFDKAGRILLPAYLRGTANLLDNAVLVGGGEYFELWSPENWQVQQVVLSDVEANKQRLEALDLFTLP